MKYAVVAKYWKSGSGFSHEEQVDVLDYDCTAEEYVNEIDDEEKDAYLQFGDSVQFLIYDENDDVVSDHWLNKD